MPKKGVKTNLHKNSNGNSVNDSVGSFNSLNEVFLPTPEQSQEIVSKFKSIIDTRLDKLYDTRGADGEMYAYGIAVNQVKKKAEQPEETPPTEDNMDKDQKLKEMIQAALSKPLNEKKKSSSFTSQYDDKFTDKRKNLPDELQKSILKKQGNLDEDLDLGHQDDEPHMIKADLYRIGKYAMELYKMVDQFEGEQEVDFPHWWQSKIIKAKDMLVSAKHYLDFELKEPQLDAMVDVASEEGAIDESLIKSASILARSSKDVDEFKKKWYEKYKSKQDAKTEEKLKSIFNSVKKSSGTIDEMSKKQIKKRGEIYDALKAKGMPNEKAGKIATSQAMKAKIKEVVLAKLKQK
jgi:hypothetical protein